MTIEEIRGYLTMLRNKLKEFEAILQPEDGRQTASEDRIEKIKKEFGKVESDIAEFEAVLLERKTFKKATFIENFKALTAKTGVKIGQIETEANVAPGYLSRLDKEGNTSDPSIEFIATSARLFNVTVDFLLYGKVENLSQTEAYLSNFFQTLINDTINDQITWSPDTSPAEFYSSGTGYPEGVTHPLYGSEWNEYKKRFDVYYNSLFEKNVKVSKEADSYISMLPNTNNFIYFMNCTRGGDSNSKADSFFECYLASESGVTPLCTSHNGCETLMRMMSTLYKEINKST